MSKFKSETVLIIGTVWPEPNSSAAGSRMLQLIQLFLSQNWEVTFATPASDSEHMVDLQDMGVNKVRILLNDASFDDFTQSLMPSIVMYDRFMMEEKFGWRVSKQCPDALRILNTEDLHCLRAVREQYFKSNIEFNTTHLLEEDISKREVASIYRCDLSLIISDFEMDLLKKTFKIDKTLLHYLPFLFSPITRKTKADWPNFEERKHFITIGNFRHTPNWNSILYLKETIWPLIRKTLPEAELHIYGAYPPPKATALHNTKEGFHIKGWAEDAIEVMKNARVCLAPLRFGAGIKGKLAEAMLCGTPSITTSIGAEGMQGEGSDWNGYINDDPHIFSKASVKLYSDKGLWGQSQQNGIAIINTRFQEEKFSPPFIDKILLLKSKLKEHRTKNFIGTMLQHHTMRSTEFMARWIEEKNK